MAQLFYKTEGHLGNKMTQPQMLQAVMRHLRDGAIKMKNRDHIGFGVVFGFVFIFGALAFRGGEYLAFAIVAGCLALSVPSYYFVIAWQTRKSSWYWDEVQQDIEGQNLREMWDTSNRGDWLLSFAAHMIGKPGWPTHQEVVLACCRCARLTVEMIQVNRVYSLNVLATTEAWTRGEATSQDVIDAERAKQEDKNRNDAEYFAMGSVKGAAWAVYAQEDGSCFRLAQAASQAAERAASAARAADGGDTRDAKERQILQECAEVVRQALQIPDKLTDELPIYDWINRWHRNWQGKGTGRISHIPVAVSRTSPEYPQVKMTGTEINNASTSPALRLATGVVTVAAICALFGALGNHPYEYYAMLRWLIIATSALLLWRGVIQGSAKWAYLLGPVAVVFNPILPTIHLRGDQLDVLRAWHTVDLLTAVALVVSIVFMELQVLLAKWSLRHATGGASSLPHALSSVPANEITDVQSRSLRARQYIVGVVVLVLLIWNPFDHTWPDLIGIPVATWLLLGWIWKEWQPDARTEKRFQRSLASATAGTLLVLAILEAMQDTHTVGEDLDEVLPGPDLRVVIILLAAAGTAFWISMASEEADQQV